MLLARLSRHQHLRHGNRSRRRPSRTALTLEMLESRTVPSLIGPFTDTLPTSPNTMALGDFYRNGHTDIVTAGVTTGNGGVGDAITVVQVNGDGTFGPPTNTYFTDPTHSHNPLWIAVGEFDGDSYDDDLAVAYSGGLSDNNTGAVLIFHGDGSGHFTLSPVPLWLNSGEECYSVAAGNFGNSDASGQGIVAVDGNYPGKAYIWLNHNGSFSIQPDGTYATNPLNVGCYSVQAVPLNPNNPSIKDLIVGTGDGFSVLKGNGDGTFQPGYVQYPSGFLGSFGGPVRADALRSGSSIPDVIGSNGLVRVDLGNGDEGPTQVATFQVYTQSYSLPPGGGGLSDVGDFASAGWKKDVVVANVGNASQKPRCISVLTGNGNGTFQPAVNYAVAGDPLTVYTGDFNHDSLSDIATCYFDGWDPAKGIYDLPQVAVFLAQSDNQAAKLTLTNLPATTTAGVSNSFTVTATDSSGNVVPGYTGTIHFTSTDPNAVLPPEYTFLPTDNGTHTFNVTFETAGNATITATDTATATITGSATATVAPAVAVSLAVAGFPSPTTAGVASNFTVTAYDAYGNIATGYTGMIQFASGDTQATLPANYTFTSADAGVHSFTATLKTAGTHSLTATDTVTTSITGSQGGIVVNPASASTLLVDGFPSPVTAGVQASFAVTADDAFGNVATGYTGTVHFTSSDGLAAFPSDYSFTSTDAGVHSFSATLKTAGTQSLTATDTVSASITGTQSGIGVSTATASQLAIHTQPSSTATAGVAFASQPVIYEEDQFGNLETGDSTSTVTATLHSGVGPLQGLTTVTVSQGVATFTNLADNKAETISLDFSSGSLTNATSNFIVINPASASTLLVSGLPSPTTAGVAHSFTVTAYDAFGNLATGYTGTVNFSSSDKQAVLAADYTFASGDQGVHSFTATLKTAGTQSLTATDKANSPITGTQTGITVNAAALDHLGVAAPSTARPGTAFNITVSAQDAYNNTITSFRDTVHFASTDKKATMPKNYTYTAADKGTHTFSVTLKTVGSQTITVTDTAHTTTKGSAAVSVSTTAAVPLAAVATTAGLRSQQANPTLTAVSALPAASASSGESASGPPNELTMARSLALTATTAKWPSNASDTNQVAEDLDLSAGLIGDSYFINYALTAGPDAPNGHDA